MNSCRIITYVFLGMLTCLVWSCGDGDDGQKTEEPTLNLSETRQEIAQHLATDFILPAYEQLAAQTNQLHTEVEAFVAAPDQAGLDQLRLSLKEGWLAWQVAAIYQFGATEANALRVAVNTYPTSTIKIEDNINEGNYQLGTIANKDAAGFPALDYLLNQEDGLLPLGGADTKRLTYLQDVSNHLNEQVRLTLEEWKNGSFLSNFTSTNANGTDVGSAFGLMVNSIDLHFQRYLRDGKLAIPAGVRSAGVPRPTTVEAYYGGYSVELLKKSLTAYFDFFKGDGVNDQSGDSFLAYLRKIDQDGVANDMEAKFEESLQKIDVLNDPLQQQIADDNQKLIDAFLSLQDLVGLFKSDMASVMGIIITNQDTDGD